MMFDPENGFAKSLPKMAEAVTEEDLKKAIFNHLEELNVEIQKLVRFLLRLRRRRNLKSAGPQLACRRKAIKPFLPTKMNQRSTSQSFPPARKSTTMKLLQRS
jgi:ferritin-like metal-binding protein YciE